MTGTPTRAPGRALRPWLLVLGIVLIGANLRASITAVGPVLGEIRSDLGLTGVTASVLISVPLLAFAVISPAAPAIANRFGMERTLGGALLLLVLAIIARSWPLSGAIWSGTVLLGVAIAVLNVIVPALIKRDFPTRVGKITGLYASVQSASAALAAGFAVPIAGTAAEGWRLSLGIWAGLALVALAVFLPQLRSRTVVGRSPGADAVQPIRSPWRSALAWQVTMFMGLQSTVYYSLITWWPSIERGGGLSPTAAGWHQFALQLISIVGNVACAAALQRVRDQRVIAAASTGLALTGIVGELIDPTLSLLWILLVGLGAGASIVLALSLFGLRTANHGQAAKLSGMAQSVGYLLAASGPILIGLLHDETASWTLPLGVIAAAAVAQLGFGILAGRDRQLG